MRRAQNNQYPRDPPVRSGPVKLFIHTPYDVILQNLVLFDFRVQCVYGGSDPEAVSRLLADGAGGVDTRLSSAG